MVTVEQLSEAVYEDLNGRIVAVSLHDDAFHVVFECDDWTDHARRRRFQLTFDDVPEATVTPSSSGVLIVEDSHSILLEHNEEHVAMFFSSAPLNPFELVGRLCEAHARFFGGWRVERNYLRANSSLLAGGHGLLAQGPKGLIAEYATAIGDRLRYSIVRCHTPRGGYRIMLFADCYVVFRNVEVVEVESCAR